jgi:hypothetical protein
VFSGFERDARVEEHHVGTVTDPDRALELVREALNIAEQLGDPETLGEVLLAYRLGGKTPDNTAAGQPTG